MKGLVNVPKGHGTNVILWSSVLSTICLYPEAKRIEIRATRCCPTLSLTSIRCESESEGFLVKKKKKQGNFFLPTSNILSVK